MCFHRALEIFITEGRPWSEILEEQHGQEGAGPLSGPLRFPDPCIIWVQCDRNGKDKLNMILFHVEMMKIYFMAVLYQRTDKRVDEMVGMGLVKEMLDFHAEYNANHIK